MKSITGKLVDGEHEFEGRVTYEDNAIKEVETFEVNPKDYTYGLKSLVTLGLVDLHVHAREDITHKHDYKETFRTASEAAIHGGVTYIGVMPNVNVPPVDKKSYSQMLNLARTSLIPVKLWAGIGPETKYISSVDGYKIFWGKSTQSLSFLDYDTLDKTIKEGGYADPNLTLLVHCETQDIIDKYTNAATHEQRRPPEAEIDGIEKILGLQEDHGFKLHVVHVSTKKGLQLIEYAKKQGRPVTCGVTLHHTLANIENKKQFEHADIMNMNPPLRNKEDSDYLIDVDCVESDHAPHTIEEKKSEKSPAGVPVEDYFAPALSMLSEKNNTLTWPKLVKMASINPAKIIGIMRAFEVDAPASFTVLEKKPTEIKDSNCKSNCGWNFLHGKTAPYRVKATIVNGIEYFVN